MNKKLIKLTIVAMASAFAFAPLAIADDEKGDKKERPERPERGERPGGERRGGPGGFDREKFIKEFDVDKDGKLDETERKAARAKMTERGKQRAEEQFTKNDTDKNGTLSVVELVASRGGDKNEEAAKRTKEFFAKADADKNGQLTKEELAKARPPRGPRGGGDRPEGGRPGRGGEGGKGGEGKGKGKGDGEGKGKGKKRPAADE